VSLSIRPQWSCLSRLRNKHQNVGDSDASTPCSVSSFRTYTWLCFSASRRIFGNRWEISVDSSTKGNWHKLVSYLQKENLRIFWIQSAWPSISPDKCDDGVCRKGARACDPLQHVGADCIVAGCPNGRRSKPRLGCSGKEKSLGWLQRRGEVT
jgi:hypothetical protein